MRTQKIYPLPLILFCSEYWRDLATWIKDTMMKNDTILNSDPDQLYIRDDPAEVVGIINRHREWKKQKIAKSTDS